MRQNTLLSVDVVKAPPRTRQEFMERYENNRLSELILLPHYSKLKINVQYSEFWDGQLENPGIIVDGKHYRIGSTPYPRRGEGFGGSEFTVRMLDTGKIIKTCDMWHQGTIPEYYQIKDNAEFVK